MEGEGRGGTGAPGRGSVAPHTLMARPRARPPAWRSRRAGSRACARARARARLNGRLVRPGLPPRRRAGRPAAGHAHGGHRRARAGWWAAGRPGGGGGGSSTGSPRARGRQTSQHARTEGTPARGARWRGGTGGRVRAEDMAWRGGGGGARAAPRRTAYIAAAPRQAAGQAGRRRQRRRRRRCRCGLGCGIWRSGRQGLAP